MKGSLKLQSKEIRFEALDTKVARDPMGLQKYREAQGTVGTFEIAI
jgi:hypothetical protein